MQPNKDDDSLVFSVSALPPDDLIRLGFESGSMDEVVKKLNPGLVITYTKLED